MSKLAQTDLNLFVVFDAIYTEQNLTRVADILHITQPAVSNALARLRVSLKDPLFVRTARGMRPTPVAQKLVESIRAGLSQFEICLEKQDQFIPGQFRRTFRISLNHAAEQIFVPALAKILASHGPNLSLEVALVDRLQAPTELSAGNLDAVIDAPLLSHPEINSLRLLSDDYVCVMRRDHPLARKRLTLNRYMSLEHVHIARLRGTGHVDLALRSLGLRRNISLQLQNYVAAPAVISATDYALSAPRRVAIQWDLAVAGLPFKTQSLEQTLYWHKSVEHDAASTWLRAKLQQIGAFSGLKH